LLVLLLLKGISERNISSTPIFSSVFLLIIVAMVILSVSIKEIAIGNHSVYASISSSNSSTAILPDFNFAAVGDWGCKSQTTDTVNNILDKNPELVIALGDYSYTTLANCWLNIINTIDEKMKIAIGNHEHTIYALTYGNSSYKSPYLLNQYMKHFGLTKQYYSFNYQNVHFIAMSTEVPFHVGSEQYNFIKSDLAAASTNSSINWIIVYFHNPMYSSPNRILPDKISRDIYHPLFDEYGVDLILQGHNHNYQRSYPLKYNSSYSGNPVITTVEKSKYNDPTDAIFVIVGTGGQSLYELDGRHLFTVIQDTTTYGFLNIDIVNDGLMMKATFYANDGTLKDQFEIDKSP
jgi:predicted MPP superfamily phosphohydrolase